MRLIDYLSAAAVGPLRRRADLLKAGAVTVNGHVVTAPERVLTEADVVCVEGVPVVPREPVVLMLHKPAGYLCATAGGGPTVLSLVPPAYGDQFLFPIGRLDKETEGLLLLTNDGGFAHRVLQPAVPIVKTYYAEHYGTAGDGDVAAFAAGMTLRDGLRCAPAGLRPLGPGRSLVAVSQGKRHQVRRMLWERHLHVRYLKRLAIGGLILDRLPRGATALLTAEERAQVFAWDASPEAVAGWDLWDRLAAPQVEKRQAP